MSNDTVVTSIDQDLYSNRASDYVIINATLFPTYTCHPSLFDDIYCTTDQDAKEKLTRNATKLLDAVCDVIQAIDVATHTLSDETRRELDLPKWVKLAESKQEIAAS